MYKRNLYDIACDVICGREGKVDYSIYCPVIESPQTGGTSTINNFSRHSSGEFINYIKNDLAPSAKQDVSVARCFLLMYQSRFMVSFKYEMNSFDKKMNPITVINGVVWNTKEGSGVALCEFFRGNVRYREMILYVISSKIREKITIGEKFYTDWYARLYSTFKTENYFVCSEGFVFLFPDGTLKEKCGRTEEYLVPFIELKNQIKTVLL